MGKDFSGICFITVSLCWRQLWRQLWRFINLYFFFFLKPPFPFLLNLKFTSFFPHHSWMYDIIFIFVQKEIITFFFLVFISDAPTFWRFFLMVFLQFFVLYNHSQYRFSRNFGDTRSLKLNIITQIISLQQQLHFFSFFFF